MKPGRPPPPRLKDKHLQRLFVELRAQYLIYCCRADSLACYWASHAVSFYYFFKSIKHTHTQWDSISHSLDRQIFFLEYKASIT